MLKGELQSWEDGNEVQEDAEGASDSKTDKTEVPTSPFKARLAAFQASKPHFGEDIRERGRRLIADAQAFRSEERKEGGPVAATVVPVLPPGPADVNVEAGVSSPPPPPAASEQLPPPPPPTIDSNSSSDGTSCSSGSGDSASSSAATNAAPPSTPPLLSSSSSISEKPTQTSPQTPTQTQTKNFQRHREDFECENCGRAIEGTGYTNHCEGCLWSKHVDINPGDRAAACGGLMRPVAVDAGKRCGYRILQRCVSAGCGHERWNKAQDGDDFEALLGVMQQSGGGSGSGTDGGGGGGGGVRGGGGGMRMSRRGGGGRSKKGSGKSKSKGGRGREEKHKGGSKGRNKTKGRY